MPSHLLYLGNERIYHMQVMIGLGITYSVTGGQSLYRFWGFTCPKNELGHCKTAMGQSAWIVSFAHLSADHSRGKPHHCGSLEKGSAYVANLKFPA
jgi:hypothetical protein